MNKETFLAALGKALEGLPGRDVDERLSFYSEMIDDRMEEGLNEEEAVDAVGSVETVAAQILEEYAQAPSKKGWKVFLILTSPIWLALLIVLLCAGLCLWAAEAALIAGAVGCVVSAVVALTGMNLQSAAATLGAGLCCAGTSVFWLKVCTAGTKGLWRMTKKAFRAIRGKMRGRRAA